MLKMGLVSIESLLFVNEFIAYKLSTYSAIYQAAGLMVSRLQLVPFPVGTGTIPLAVNRRTVINAVIVND